MSENEMVLLRQFTETGDAEAFPAHEALGAFKLTFLREEARVHLPGESGTNYVWRQSNREPA